MRLGLLGGTFDPIHLGHLDAATAARTLLDLDRVLLVPSLAPPHRPVQPLASSYHRFAMAALAVDGLDGLAVSDVEVRSTGPSYTARTLARLRSAGWQPWQLFFITGGDAFAEIATWHDYPAVLDAGHFVVVSRPGHGVERVRSRVPGLADRIVSIDAGNAGRRGGPDTSSDTSPTRVFFIEARTTDASSTAVRERIVSGEAIEGLVPAAVARHIRQHRLYLPAEAGSPVA
jgi:nicotinate-nucleotide adenylyltransferase